MGQGTSRWSIALGVIATLILSGGSASARAAGPEAPERTSSLGAAPQLREIGRSRVRTQVAETAASAIDTSDRDAVERAYRRFMLLTTVPLGWTGSIDDCDPGEISGDFRDATHEAVNYFRALVGLPGVTFSSDLDRLSQAAALIMQAQQGLTHQPDEDAPCYTAAGATGAANSNMSAGAIGAWAIWSYVKDWPANTRAAGHRRWLLYPPQTVMGSGATPEVDALYVFDTAQWARPADAPDWVAWPPAGYVPYQQVTALFTLSRADADFEEASVRVTIDGKVVDAAIADGEPVYGDPAVAAWVDVDGADLDDGHEHVIATRVSGVDVDGSPVTYEWRTTSFAPTVPVATVAPSRETAFDRVAVGTASQPETFQITDTGPVDLHTGLAYIAGERPDMYSIVRDGCSLRTLAPGESCTVDVVFRPSAEGVHWADLLVPSDTVEWHYQPISLVGRGIVPDTTPPTAGAPTVAINAGGTFGSSALVHVAWKAGADDVGIAGYQLQRSSDGGATWASVSLAKPSARSADVRVRAGSSAVTFRMRATDAAGNTSAWEAGSPFTLRAIQESSASVLFRGNWKSSTLSGASGGRVRYASGSGRRATLTKVATGFGIVSAMGPDRGKAEVWVDGRRVKTIDLYAAKRRAAKVIWSTSLPSGQHSVQLRVLGTKARPSRGVRVDLDAILVMAGPSGSRAGQPASGGEPGTGHPDVDTSPEPAEDPGPTAEPTTMPSPPEQDATAPSPPATEAPVAADPPPVGSPGPSAGTE